MLRLLLLVLLLLRVVLLLNFGSLPPKGRRDLEYTVSIGGRCGSSGYMAEFKDLRIKSVLLDDIMAHPEQPDKSMVIDFETRSLRDARHLLVSNRIPDAMQFIEDNSHPVSVRRCWLAGWLSPTHVSPRGVTVCV